MFGRIFQKKQKATYKVEVHVMINNGATHKIEITTTAYSRKQAMQKIRETVGYKIVRAHKVKK